MIEKKISKEFFLIGVNSSTQIQEIVEVSVLSKLNH
jgi:hypothetical protein